MGAHGAGETDRDAMKPRKAPRKHIAVGSWVELGGQRFYARSKAERARAGVLELVRVAGLIRSWQHEPRTFYFPDVKRGAVSYKPDFSVTYVDGTVVYEEVKGWWDAKSVQKLALMARHYPHIFIETIGAQLKPAQRARIEKARDVGMRAAAKKAKSDVE